MTPENGGDELEEGDYVLWPGLRARGFAIEEQVQQAETYGMALCI